MSAQPPSGQSLLLLIDPSARSLDGESVRVARDVLGAGAPVKVCIPESPEELERALEHRGRRTPVVVGDDRALHRVVQELHRRRELATAPLAHVPVGPSASVPLALALGLPAHPAPAARAVLSGVERSFDLLVDDRGAVVLGTVQITGFPEAEQATAQAAGRHGGAWWAPVRRGAAALARSLRIPAGGQIPRLRVEADGEVLTDLDQPVRSVSLSNARPVPGDEGSCPDDGLMEVAVHVADRAPIGVCARVVTVTGQMFRYHADAEPAGPVRTRTWTVLPRAWRLTVPAGRRPLTPYATSTSSSSSSPRGT